MRRSILTAGLAVLSLCGAAVAQESGGVGLDPSIKDGPHGLARPMQFTRPPFFTAQSVQNGMTSADHQAADQNAITQLRGDPGYLSGFQFGTPTAASRQPSASTDPGGWYRHNHAHGQAPVIINNDGPLALTVGNGNVVQQSSANGSGPIALQQVATKPSAPSVGTGALNIGSANIVQRAPGGN